jgi:hypothetical protein
MTSQASSSLSQSLPIVSPAPDVLPLQHFSQGICVTWETMAPNRVPSQTEFPAQLSSQPNRVGSGVGVTVSSEIAFRSAQPATLFQPIAKIIAAAASP